MNNELRVLGCGFLDSLLLSDVTLSLSASLKTGLIEGRLPIINNKMSFNHIIYQLNHNKQ